MNLMPVRLFLNDVAYKTKWLVVLLLSFQNNVNAISQNEAKKVQSSDNTDDELIQPA